MNCAEVSQKIELFVLGEVPKPERIAIQAHLATCPACKAAEDQYCLLIAQIKQASQPDSLRLGFVRAVHFAVKAEIQAIIRRSRRHRIVAITVSVAACFLFASLIWYKWLRPCTLSPPSEQARGTRDDAYISGLSAPSVLQVWQRRGALSVPGSMADEVVVRGQSMYLLQEKGRQTHVAALDVKTGKQNWLSDIQCFGHILADHSRVYCLALGGAGKMDLVALDSANGRTLWRYSQQCPDQLRNPCRPFLLPAGRICWTTNTTIQMLSCANGELLWAHSIPEGGLLSVAASVNDEIYVANADGLYCLNVETGDECWRLAYSGVKAGRERQRPLLAAADAKMYVSLNLGMGAGWLFSVDLAARKILWSRDLAYVTHLYPIGDMLYLRDQNVRAVDGTTGQLLWTCPATGCNPVTYAEGLAYFVDSRDQGHLVALDRYTGSKVWELAGMKSCNAFIKIDTTGYVKTHDGVVHAFSFKG